jgi:hypothetical protein
MNSFDWRGFSVVIFIQLSTALACWLYFLEDIVATERMSCLGESKCELAVSLDAQSWPQYILLVWILSATVLILALVSTPKPPRQSTQNADL